jgi:CRP-like cAMP-binding protein
MAKFEEKVFDVGEKIFTEGDDGDAAYLIKSGKVKIVKEKDEDSHRTIATIEAGQVIGEMSLIDDQPRAASAIVLEETVVMVISKENLQERLDKTDPVVVRLLNTFTDRLRKQSEAIIDLMQ